MATGAALAVILVAAVLPSAEEFETFAAAVVTQLEVAGAALTRPEMIREDVEVLLVEVSLGIQDFYRAFGPSTEWADAVAAAIDQELFAAHTWYGVASDYRFRSREPVKFQRAYERAAGHLRAAKAGLKQYARRRGEGR